MPRWICTLLGLGIGFGLSGVAHAFPHTIGHGYGSCINCHFNPVGGGPLTDYGRAVGATAMAAVPFFVRTAGLTPEEVDEKVGRQSGFLGESELPRWLRPGVNFRGLYLRQDLTGATPLSRWITMQAEANLVLKSNKDRTIAVARLGYIPVPETVSRNQKDAARSLISREHYIGTRLTRALGVYGGMMDAAFGLRVPDHSAYLRSKTLLNQNDQTHGLLLHYGVPNAELALHVMTGNLYQDSGLRQRGLSGVAELEAGRNSRLGASAFVSQNDYRRRSMGALHGRFGFDGTAALLGQFGVIREAPVSQQAQTGGYFFGQYQAPISRGVSALVTTEYYTADWSRQAQRRYRAGPSIQYLPMQRLEFRVDLLGSRFTGGSSLEPDSVTLQSQVHVWL